MAMLAGKFSAIDVVECKAQAHREQYRFQSVLNILDCTDRTDYEVLHLKPTDARLTLGIRDYTLTVFHGLGHIVIC